jgi:release factor glutamine methyltransferase
MTIGEELHAAAERLSAAGIDDAQIEAEVLLCHALGVRRAELFASLREPLPARTPFEQLVARRLAHEPSAYITGHREFYGLDLLCAPEALIPRPETELLVESALEWLSRPRPATRDPRPCVIDAGTGSGAIAIAVAVNAPGCCIVGIDRSGAALCLAHRNAVAHGVQDRVAFVRGDLLSGVRVQADLIVANLPYIPTRLYEKLPPEIHDHEPEEALHAGRRGTALIEALLAQAPAHLKPGGLLLAEHAWNQGRRLREAARFAFADARVETKRDLAGQERMLVVET